MPMLHALDREWASSSGRKGPSLFWAGLLSGPTHLRFPGGGGVESPLQRRRRLLRFLLAALEAQVGERLLLQGPFTFWTEHSDRAGPESHLAGRAGGSALLCWPLGSPGGEDSYVRTVVRIVKNMQRFTAEHVRRSFAGGPDFFGEEHLSQQLRNILNVHQGWDEVSRQLETLREADYEADPAPIASLSDTGHWQRPAFTAIPATSELWWPQPRARTSGRWWPRPRRGRGGPRGFAGCPGSRELAEKHANQVPIGYEVSILFRGAFHRLHFAVSCWRIPGVHYLEYEV